MQDSVQQHKYSMCRMGRYKNIMKGAMKCVSSVDFYMHVVLA
eukprot:gene11703-8051_t